MFIDNFFSVEVVQKVYSKGKIEVTEGIFREFNNFLITLGLDVALSTFRMLPIKDITINCTDNGNEIAIYLKSTKNFIEQGFDSSNNWNESYINTGLIKEKWKELASKYNLPESYYNYVAHVFVYDFEKAYLHELTREAKPELTEKILGKKWSVKPEYIFRSSLPELSIIYQNPEDYDRAFKEGLPQKITDLANEILHNNDRLNMFRNGMVEINFYHRQMDLNLHGMSRED